MPASTAAPARDPAVAIRLVAGTCWALTAALVLADTPGGCHGGLSAEGAALAGAGGSRPATAFAAWLVMTGAMMLPTVVPLARMVVAVTARLPHPAAPRLAVLAGYLAVWTGFAAVAMLGHLAVDVLVGDTAPQRVLGAVLVVAGLYQLSPAKRACLTACRSPWAFLWRFYRRGVRGGWTLGVRHGLFCLGCCWALMLVMVATGAGSLLWMLALTGVMVVEKTVAWGARLVVPVGIALVVAGVAVLATDGTGASTDVALLVAVTALAAVRAGSALRRRGRRPRPAPPSPDDEDRTQRVSSPHVRSVT